LPSTKLEEWKNTSIQTLLGEEFAVGSSDSGRSVTIDAALIDNLDAYKIVLVNGNFRSDLSDVPTEKGVEVASLSNSWNHPIVLTHFAQYADKADNPMVNINTALAEDGFF